MGGARAAWYRSPAVWRLPRTERTKYRRTPLLLVLAQARFRPILKLSARVSDFQELVRASFPEFGIVEQRTIEMRTHPESSAQVFEEPLFEFTSPSGHALRLSPRSLTLQTRAYTTREDFVDHFGRGLAALREVAGHVALHRLGMRFVNGVLAERVASDLGRASIDWSELITAEFRRVPESLVDDAGTFFALEVTSRLERGAMTLRSGVVPGSPALPHTHFRFDIDRYIDGEVPADVEATLLQFAEEASAVFEAAAGPSLRRWMKGEDHGP